ncbi:hypothetical protein E4U12_007632 [Claviceps purpurea]|nr:hypothetical protein E4U12_007632 [Claviceps purpurea]
MKYRNRKHRVEKSSAGSTTTGADNPHIGQRYVLVERQSGSVLIAVGEGTVLQTCGPARAQVPLGFHSQWHWHWDCVDDDG